MSDDKRQANSQEFNEANRVLVEQVRKINALKEEFKDSELSPRDILRIAHDTIFPGRRHD